LPVSHVCWGFCYIRTGQSELQVSQIHGIKKQLGSWTTSHIAKRPETCRCRDGEGGGESWMGMVFSHSNTKRLDSVHTAFPTFQDISGWCHPTTLPVLSTHLFNLTADFWAEATL
jgi:hypothetical protein